MALSYHRPGWSLANVDRLTGIGLTVVDVITSSLINEQYNICCRPVLLPILHTKEGRRETLDQEIWWAKAWSPAVPKIPLPW